MSGALRIVAALVAAHSAVTTPPAPAPPTKWICDSCQHVYNPAVDDPAKKNTPFEQLPDSWTCPVCNAPKSSYSPQLMDDGTTVWAHVHHEKKQAGEHQRASGDKGPCTDYFGPDVDSNATTGTLWTVADTDVHEGFPFGNETFVHHSGPHSECFSPGPPKGCHRYYVASYEASKCGASCPLVGGGARGLAGNIDTKGAFDRASGVLKGCFDCLLAVKIACYAAPADAPVSCTCPGSAPDLPGLH
jgi:rubredoxin